MNRLFFIDLFYACFGIIAKDDRIIHVQPIARWMRGKTLQQVKPWLLKKRAKVQEWPLIEE